MTNTGERCRKCGEPIRGLPGISEPWPCKRGGACYAATPSGAEPAEDVELDSPNYVNPGTEALAARDFKRVNRGTTEDVGPLCGHSTKRSGCIPCEGWSSDFGATPSGAEPAQPAASGLEWTPHLIAARAVCGCPDCVAPDDAEPHECGVRVRAASFARTEIARVLAELREEMKYLPAYPDDDGRILVDSEAVDQFIGAAIDRIAHREAGE